jgi:hypothetical protein
MGRANRLPQCAARGSRRRRFGESTPRSEGSASLRDGQRPAYTSWEERTGVEPVFAAPAAHFASSKRRIGL